MREHAERNAPGLSVMNHYIKSPASFASPIVFFTPPALYSAADNGDTIDIAIYENARGSQISATKHRRRTTAKVWRPQAESAVPAGRG